MKKTALSLALTAIAGAALSACGASTSADRTLTVFAAASLKPVFSQLQSRFEQAHPGVRVVFQFGGSSDLVSSIKAGQTADVFASADEKNMGKLGAIAHSPARFATNTLEIATPPGNPAHVASFADLTRVALVDCAVEVPCGTAAQTLARKLGVVLTPVSQEQSVADVLGKVEAGQADAGLVYVTDVKAAGSKVTGVPIAGADTTVNVYEIAALQNAPQATLAAEWVTFVTGPAGQAALQAAGFGRP